MTCAVCRSAMMMRGRGSFKPSWVETEEGAEECVCQFDPEGKPMIRELEGCKWLRSAGMSASTSTQKLSFVTGRSLLESVVWLLMRLRLRFILDKSLSNTSPDRSADTRSSNSPPSSSPFAFAFRAFRSFSLCSFSWWQKWKIALLTHVSPYIIT